MTVDELVTGTSPQTGPPPAAGPPTLGAVVEALGVGLVTVVAAPRGLDVAAGEPVVHDPLGEVVVGPADVLLAVGVDSSQRTAADLVARCGQLGAAAVVVQGGRELPDLLVRAAERSGVALLVAAPGVAWGQLHSLLRTARSATAQRGRDVGGVPVGDLFALADALSAMLGGAVTVEDEHSTVLAYSSTQHPTDQPRQDTILGRRVPSEWLTRLRDDGVFRRLWGGDEVIQVGPPQYDIAPRLAVAVRAGGEVLGSIWVQEGERAFRPEDSRILRETAPMAALHLLRQRSGDDLERRRSGDQLRGVLDGRLPAGLLAETLGVPPDRPVGLLALHLGADEATADVLLSVDRAVDVLALTCRTYRRSAVAAAVGHTAYLVFLARELGDDALRRLAAELAERVSEALSRPVTAAVGCTPAGVVGLIEARRDVDLALRVLRPQHTVAHVDDVRAGMVLLELRDLVATAPQLVAGKVRVLQQSDSDRGTSYVSTLRAYLDCFGDVRAAADRVGVHPNTFRYRLRRLVVLSGLDLDDPVDRLVSQLQLHLLVP